MAAVLARHLEGAHVGMIDGQVRALGELQPEQAGRDVERRRDHVVELQVGFHLRLVDVVLGLAHLLRVVAPVPARHLEVAAFRHHGLLQFVALLARTLARRLPHLHQQLAHVRGPLRHGELERRIG